MNAITGLILLYAIFACVSITTMVIMYACGAGLWSLFGVSILFCAPNKLKTED